MHVALIFCYAGEEQKMDNQSLAYFFFTPKNYLGEQEWHSGESTRLPPMWPGFDSRTRHHMWVEFFVGSRPWEQRLSRNVARNKSFQSFVLKQNKTF